MRGFAAGLAGAGWITACTGISFQASAICIAYCDLPPSGGNRLPFQHRMLRVQASGQASQQLASSRTCCRGTKAGRGTSSTPHFGHLIQQLWLLWPGPADPGGRGSFWQAVQPLARPLPAPWHVPLQLSSVLRRKTTISAFVVVYILRKMVQVFHAVTDVSLSKGAANLRGWGGMWAALSPCSSAASGFLLHVSLNILMSVFRARKSSLKGKLYPCSSD